MLHRCVRTYIHASWLSGCSLGCANSFPPWGILDTADRMVLLGYQAWMCILPRLPWTLLWPHPEKLDTLKHTLVPRNTHACLSCYKTLAGCVTAVSYSMHLKFTGNIENNCISRHSMGSEHLGPNSMWHELVCTDIEQPGQEPVVNTQMSS